LEDGQLNQEEVNTAT